MRQFIVRRLGLLLLVVFGVVTVTFLLVRAAPGDPATTYLGDKATPDQISALRKEWGLDQPIFVQYVQFLFEIVTGNLGRSLFFHASNLELISNRLPTTLLLMVMSIVIAAVISLPLATWIAVRGRGGSDVFVRIFNALALGLPTFLIGLLLIILFGLTLKWFPVGGFGTTFGQQLYSLVLPSISIAVGFVPLLVNSLRESLGGALRSDFVAFAYSKGLTPFRVLSAYVIRNGIISAVTILGLRAGGLVGGSLVVENIFNLPGLGTMMLSGILNRDFPVVQSVTIVYAVLVVLVYLLTDLLYAFIDPRVELA